jgi:gas vesicle protein
VWLLAGVTIGVAAAILFAPRSGKETRDSLADSAARGRDVADRKRREAMRFGREVYDQGRELAAETVDSGKEILERGRQLASDAKEVGQEALGQGKKILEDLSAQASGSPASSSGAESES